MGLGKAEISFTVLHAERVPEGNWPRWAVLGRSNVGKSSLLNAMIHPQELFRKGKTPGVTTGLVAAKVWLGKSEDSILEIVDVPGFGYAKKKPGQEREEWQPLMDALKERSYDRGLHWLWLVDPSRQPGEEEFSLAKWLGREPFTLVFTKSDQVKRGERTKIEGNWKKYSERASEGPFWVSSTKGEGFKELFQSARSFVRLQNQPGDPPPEEPA